MSLYDILQNMSWFAYSLLALMCFSVLNLLTRIVAVKSVSPRASSFVFNVWGAIIATVLFLLKESVHSLSSLKTVSSYILILTVLSILLYAAYERLHFSVRKQIDASTIAILFRLSPALTFVFSILILKENFSVTKLLGMILILAGNMLLVWKGVSLKVNKSFWLGILCTVFLGLAWTIDKRVSSFLPPTVYTWLLWVGPVLFIFLPSIPFSTIKKEVFLGSWKIPLMAFLNVVGFYFQIVALSLADATRVVPIISTSSMITVLLGIWILHERSDMWKKVFSAVLATGGVLLLR